MKKYVCSVVDSAGDYTTFSDVAPIKIRQLYGEGVFIAVEAGEHTGIFYAPRSIECNVKEVEDETP